MKTIYSIGVDFAAHGVGVIAYYAVRALNEARIIKKLYCMSHRKTSIPEQVIEDIFPFGCLAEKAIISLAKMLGSANGYAFKDFCYDSLVSKRLEASEIFHVWSMQGVKSLVVAKKYGSKTILERPQLHIVAQKKFFEEEYSRFNIKKKFPIDDMEIERNLVEYDEADHIIVPSNFAYETFQQQGFDVSKIVILPYGYDEGMFFPREKPRDKFRVLFCGQICTRKGIQYLLKAWKMLKLKNAELILVGKVFPDVQTLVNQHMMSSSDISTKNFSVYKNMTNYYNSSNLFVFPSIQEGSALVTYEAMGCGMPVITTENAGSVVRDGIDGFIVPIRNADAIAEKIQYYYDNQIKVEEMGKAAAGRVKEFTWKKYGEKLITLYTSLLKKSE